MTLTCKGNLQPEFPSDTDELGTHRALVEALESQIRTGSQGARIAIVGPRGAGKSSVIAQLVKRLETRRVNSEKRQREVRVLKLDAWSAADRPVRREFVRSVERVLSASSKSDGHWARDIQGLSELTATLLGERTVHHTRRSNSGRTTLLAAAIFALGTAVKLDPKVAVIAVLAVVATICFSAVRRISEFLERWVPWLFTTEESVETRRAGDELTDSELIRFVRDQVAPALASDKLRCLVVILENLDRAEARAARATVTAMGVVAEALYAEHRESLLFVIGAASSQQKSPPEAGLTDEELQKCFDAVVRIAETRPVHWRNFARRLLTVAFPQHSGEIEDTVRALDIALRRDRCTPRVLKAIVNDTVLLHDIWQHEFPLHRLVQYAAWCATREPTEQRIDGPALSRLAHGGADPMRLRADFQRLSASIDPSSAASEIAADQIRIALQNGGDVTALLREAADYDTARSWIEQTSGGWRNAGAALLCAVWSIAGAEDKDTRALILLELLAEFRSVKQWGSLNDRAWAGIRVLAKQSNDARDAVWMRLPELLPHESRLSPADCAPWTDLVFDLALRWDEGSPPTLALAVHPETLAGVAKCALGREQGARLGSWVKISATDASNAWTAVGNALAGFDGGPFPEHWIELAIFLVMLGYNTPDSVVSQLRKHAFGGRRGRPSNELVPPSAEFAARYSDVASMVMASGAESGLRRLASWLSQLGPNSPPAP